MLDQTCFVIPVPFKSVGQVLFDAVVNKLQLLEADYFDLEYNDSDLIPCWLDRDKPIIKQVSPSDPHFRLLVKFYTPDPGLLEEELTRYLYALQIKRDLATGLLFCQEHTAVLLASYVVQAEVGNYCEELVDQNYLSTLKLLPNQTSEIEMKIIEHHKEHFGQTPGEADFNLLDTARKVEFYGIHMHPAKDHEGISLHLAVAHLGILVFQNFTKINSFSWAKIRKLCFKRKKFMIKLHPENYAYNKDTVEFYFSSRNWSKNFWKRCIEHHAFFRCHTVKHVARSKSRVVSRGSSFRYSGKTQKELVEYVRENFVRPAIFERSSSLRTMSVLNSRTGTPKTGTLNSRDLHVGQHASFSSGSHTLEHSHPANSTSFDHTVHIDERDEFSEHNDKSHALQTFYMQRNGHTYINHPQQQQHQPYELQQMQQYRITSSTGGGNSIGYNNESSFDEQHSLQRASNLHSDGLHSTASLNRFQAYMPPPPHQTAMEGGGDSIVRGGGERRALYHHTSTHTSAVNDEEFLLPPPPPPIYDDSIPSSRQHMINKGVLQNDHPRLEDTMATRTSKSTTSAASITLTSNASIMSSQTDESEEESRRKNQRFAADRSYYLAKELLMTERTYKKDLELVTQILRETLTTEDALPTNLMDLIFEPLTPIYEFHCGLLRDIEQRLSLWEGRTSLPGSYDCKKVGDLLVNMPVLRNYQNYLERHEEMLLQLDSAMKKNKDLEQVLTEFEAQKVCYLPLNAFLMKPLQRLLHYKLLIEKLLKEYGGAHPDAMNCKVCLEQLNDITRPFEERLRYLVNWQKLMDLQRDLCGCENLVQPNRLFIRGMSAEVVSERFSTANVLSIFRCVAVYESHSNSKFTIQNSWSTTVERNEHGRF